MTRLRGLFVTGTDTGVGKTTISMALLRQARRLGLTPIPFKPAETGCHPEPADARALWRAAQPPVAADEVCLYALALPVAPAAAAAAEAVQIDVDRIVTHARHLATRGDFLLVEGAGGLLVPYAPGITCAELARRLELPIAVVARTALGTVNHTALTLREAARHGLEVRAVVLNKTEAATGPQEPGNAELIASLCGLRPLGPFPWCAPGDAREPDHLADALLASLGERAVGRLLGLG